MLLLGMIRVQVVSFRMIILKKRNLPFAHNCSSTASDDVLGYSSLSTIKCPLKTSGRSQDTRMFQDQQILSMSTTIAFSTCSRNPARKMDSEYVMKRHVSQLLVEPRINRLCSQDDIVKGSRVSSLKETLPSRA